MADPDPREWDVAHPPGGRISVPLAALPPAGIVAVGATGAIVGPAWAVAVAAMFVTALGMWVARETNSPKMAVVVGTTGLVLAAGGVLYYANHETPESRDSSKSHQPAETPGVNLGGMDLRGLNLTRAILTNANLRSTNFTRACLRAIDLRGADLTDAIFTDSDVSGALIDNEKQTTAAINWPTAPPTPSPCG